MFTITTRIRALVALAAVGATLGSTAVATAAPVGHTSFTPAVGSPATVGHYPVTTTPIVVNQPLHEHVSPVKGAASVGIAGYDDATCESLANDNNTAVRSGDQAVAAGDNEAAASSYQLANTIYQQMSANCMVID
jgi:hypothetical protein